MSVVMVSYTRYRRIEDAFPHRTSLACSYPRVRRDFVDTLNGGANSCAQADVAAGRVTANE